MEGRRKFSLPKHLQGIPLFPSLMVSRTSLSVWSSHKNNTISISLKVTASNIKILNLASLKCLPSLCLYLGAHLKWTSAFQTPLLAPPHLHSLVLFWRLQSQPPEVTEGFQEMAQWYKVGRGIARGPSVIHCLTNAFADPLELFYWGSPTAGHSSRARSLLQLAAYN